MSRPFRGRFAPKAETPEIRPFRLDRVGDGWRWVLITYRSTAECGNEMQTKTDCDEVDPPPAWGKGPGEEELNKYYNATGKRWNKCTKKSTGEDCADTADGTKCFMTCDIPNFTLDPTLNGWNSASTYCPQQNLFNSAGWPADWGHPDRNPKNSDFCGDLPDGRGWGDGSSWMMEEDLPDNEFTYTLKVGHNGFVKSQASAVDDASDDELEAATSECIRRKKIQGEIEVDGKKFTCEPEASGSSFAEQGGI